MKSSHPYKTHHYLRRHLNATTHSLRNGDSSPDLLTVSTTQKQAVYGTVGGGGFVADDYANGLQI